MMSTPLKKPKSERRKSNRKYTHGHADVVFVNGEESSLSVQVMNISEGGVRIVTSDNMEGGETFIIQLEGGERKCRVMDSKKLFKGYAIRSEYVN